MKPFTWLALPVLAISTHALVIPPSTDISHDVSTIAGSIAQTNTTHVSNSTKSALELEYEALDLLKQQLFHLHHEVVKKERDILDIINQDFRSCSGVKCYLQTALRKAPDFFELFKTHFQHHSKNSTSSYGCLWSTNSSRSLVDPTTLESTENPFDFDAGQDGKPLFNFDQGEDDSSVDFNAEANNQPPLELDGGDRKHPSDFKSDEQERPHHRPGPGHHPGYHDGQQPHQPAYDPNKPNDTPPAFHPSGHNPHHERPPFHMPHPAPRPRHYKLILATAGLSVSLLILIVLFKALRIYCANPRVRAERAARKEECRTKREYRRAACQHRLRQCLSRFRFRRRSRALSTDDYEEKRAAIQASINNIQPANVENHIIGADITSLRRAHELVGQLMRAEEGRSFSFAATQPEPLSSQTQEPQPFANPARSIHSIRTTTTLPPYAPPPPRYSQELAREMHVVDGFRYTPTQSDATPTSSASSFIIDDDVTEGTSVVDCRSRLSMETEMEIDGRSARGRGRGRSRSCGKMSFELAGDRYRGRFD